MLHYLMNAIVSEMKNNSDKTAILDRKKAFDMRRISRIIVVTSKGPFL